MRNAVIVGLLIVFAYAVASLGATASYTTLATQSATWQVYPGVPGVQKYTVTWSYMNSIQEATPDYWDSKDSVRFISTFYTASSYCPNPGYSICPFAVRFSWVTLDTVMDAGNGTDDPNQSDVDSLVSDMDSVFVTVQTSTDESNWFDLLTFSGQDDTSTVFWYLTRDSLSNYLPGRYYRLKTQWIAWGDSIVAEIDSVAHLTNNTYELMWLWDY